MRISSLFVGIICVLGVASIGAQAGEDILTPLESLQVENARLETRLHEALTERDGCRGQLAPLRYTRDGETVQRHIQALKSQIEQAHPGYTLDDTGRLIRRPPPASPETQPHD